MMSILYQRGNSLHLKYHTSLQAMLSFFFAIYIYNHIKQYDVSFSYTPQFMENLKHLLDSQLFCDISIQVSTETFQAHQVVLAAGGQYFRAMFASAMYDIENRCITLHDVAPSTFQSLLTFIYTGVYCICEHYNM